MDRDEIITAVARLEAIADRFEKVVEKVDDHGTRIASLEQSRMSGGKLLAMFVGPVIVGLVLFFLIGRK